MYLIVPRWPGHTWNLVPVVMDMIKVLNELRTNYVMAVLIPKFCGTPNLFIRWHEIGCSDVGATLGHWFTPFHSMLAATAIARMSRNRSSAALARTHAIAAHMSTGPTPPLDQVVPCLPTIFGSPHSSQPVLCQSNGCARTYVLNRANKLNALNSEMINSLRPQLDVSGRQILFVIRC